MGRYVDWDDCVDRYRELNSLGGSDELSSYYIVYAEAFVDGVLSTHYTPPFSNNNMTVRDLCIDMAYYRAARFKLDDAIAVNSSFWETVGLLKNGQLQMFDEAGTLIPAIEKTLVYSNTQSYHTAFGMDDVVNWKIDEDQAEDDRTSR